MRYICLNCGAEFTFEIFRNCEFQSKHPVHVPTCVYCEPIKFHESLGIKKINQEKGKEVDHAESK